MGKQDSNAQSPETTSATVGYEAQLWQMADALRMDSAEYKHGVLGLIFLKYISFEEQHARLMADKASGADPKILTSTARRRSSGCHRKLGGSISERKPAKHDRPLADDAMAGIERHNRDVPPKDHARPALDKTPIHCEGGLRSARVSFD